MNVYDKIKDKLWVLIKDDLVFSLLLPKPKPINVELTTRLSGYHFQYAFELDIESDFIAPRKQ